MAMFQKMMNMVLQSLEGVLCYISGILISGESEASHNLLLEKVFTRLKEYGIRLKQEKCQILLSKVLYLVHEVSSNGVQPLLSKIDAITKAPVPKNIQQLRSFVGLVNYHGKFIPNLASTLQPLNMLLQFGTKWTWSAEKEKSFTKAKEHRLPQLKSSPNTTLLYHLH